VHRPWTGIRAGNKDRNTHYNPHEYLKNQGVVRPLKIFTKKIVRF
jgi:hypothetical protein